MRQIRNCGLNMFEYVRNAGLPSLTYSYDIHGCSDTALKEATRAVAKSVMPPAAGKNPRLAMNAATAIAPEVDPAFCCSCPTL